MIDESLSFAVQELWPYRVYTYGSGRHQRKELKFNRHRVAVLKMVAAPRSNVLLENMDLNYRNFPELSRYCEFEIMTNLKEIRLRCGPQFDVLGYGEGCLFRAINLFRAKMQFMPLTQGEYLYMIGYSSKRK